MAIIEFNLPNEQYHYSFQKELDGLFYDFMIRYNKRIDLFTIDINDVLYGVSLVGGVDLTAGFKHLDVPQGTLELHDRDGLYRDSKLDVFPERVILRYIEP